MKNNLNSNIKDLNLRQSFAKLHKSINTGSYQTRNTYRKAVQPMLNYFNENFRITRMDSIKSKHIESWVEYRLYETETDTSTIRKEIAAIKWYLNHTNVPPENYNITNRELGISRANEDIRPKLHSMTESEYQKAVELTESQGKDFENNGIRLMATCGLRLNELVNLTVRQVENANETGILELRKGCKGGRYREIKLDDEGKSLMSEISQSRFCQGRYLDEKVFVDSNKTGAVSSRKSQLQGWFSRYGAQIKDPDTDSLSCHSVRRLAAQRVYDSCRNEGLSPQESLHRVAEFLGHSSHRGRLEYNEDGTLSKKSGDVTLRYVNIW